MLCTIDVFQIGNARLDDDQKEQERRNHRNIDADSLLGYRVVDFSFTEELLKPNEFTFTLRRESLKKNDNTNSYQIVDVILGKPVTCQLTMAGNQFTIEGKIAKVSMKGLSVTCVAYGTEAELQGAPRCRCFYGKKLSAIVEEVLNAYQDNGNATFGNKTIGVHSDFQSAVLPYVVQYNESDYDFLVRLAKRFGAFFYYNPKTKVLNFGKIPTTVVEENLTSDPLAQRHGDVASVSYELEMIDSGFRNVAYYDEKGAVLDSDLPNITSFVKEALMAKVVKSSHDAQAATTLFYDDPNRLPCNPKKETMNKYAKDMSSGMLSNNTVCYFTCYNLNVHVGTVVNVDKNGPVLVTSAKFTWESDGSLQSENKAMLLLGNTVAPVAADTIFAPYMDINAYPRSSAQRAIVVDNVDPLKMGRVLVRFAWQDVGVAANYDVPDVDNSAHLAARKQYPWIRIAQPYGGGNKGCYILPEIGEEVMVGFENDNMEKPFIIGSLFHDSATAAEKQMPDEAWVETKGMMLPPGQNPANQKNEVKAFRTKKGHTIEFHDVDGDQNFGYIRIYNNNKPNDPNYEIVLSTDAIKTGQNHDQSYTITSASTGNNKGFDDYSVDNLRIMVRSNGGDIMLDAGAGDIIMNAANIRLHTTADRTTYIEGNDITKVKEQQYVEAKTSKLVVNEEQSVEAKTSKLVVNEKRVVNVEKEFEIRAEEFGMDVSEGVTVSGNSLVSSTAEKTEIRAKSFSSVISDSAEIKAKSIDTNAANDFKLTVGKNASIHSAEKVDLLGMTMKIQGQNTDITGTFFNIKATTQGTRSGQWTDM